MKNVLNAQQKAVNVNIFFHCHNVIVTKIKRVVEITVRLFSAWMIVEIMVLIFKYLYMKGKCNVNGSCECNEGYVD